MAMAIKWKNTIYKKKTKCFTKISFRNENRSKFVLFSFSVQWLKCREKKRISFHHYSSNFEMMRLLGSEYFLNWCESGYDLFIMEAVDCIAIESICPNKEMNFEAIYNNESK